jgi:hypothetical protein
LVWDGLTIDMVLSSEKKQNLNVLLGRIPLLMYIEDLFMTVRQNQRRMRMVNGDNQIGFPATLEQQRQVSSTLVPKDE